MFERFKATKARYPSPGDPEWIDDGRLPEEQPGVLWDPGRRGERVALSALQTEASARRRRDEDESYCPPTAHDRPWQTETPQPLTPEEQFGPLVTEILMGKIFSKIPEGLPLSVRLSEACRIGTDPQSVDLFMQASDEARQILGLSDTATNNPS